MSHDGYWEDNHLLSFPMSTWEELIGNWRTVLDEVLSFGGLHDNKGTVKMDPQGLDRGED